MIYPCIDIQKGEVVQLVRGQERGIEIAESYSELADLFADAGVAINVIDLDGAKEEGSNLDAVEEIVKKAEARVGGGIRTAEKAAHLIGIGAKKVIIGTNVFDGDRLAYDFLEKLAGTIGKDKVIVALDVKDGKIAINGWQKYTGINPLAVASELEQFCSEIQCTYVDREGMMAGTNIDFFKSIRDKTGLKLTAAGGISTLEEVEELEKIGANSVIGMSFYAGNISLEDVMRYNQLDFIKGRGFIPTIVQNIKGNVLYLQSTNRDSLRKTIETGRVWRYSKTNGMLLEVGSESGKTEYVQRILTNCYRDTLLFVVSQKKNFACHLGYETCFFRELSPEGLFEINQQRVVDPKKAYGGK